jgi:GAF domain-containing protein
VAGNAEHDGAEQVDGVMAAVAVVARALRVADARLQPTLEAIVSTAAAATGFQAGLVLVSDGRLVPQATSGRTPHLLDRFQQQRGTGPCLDAARLREPVRISDTAAERRWSGFCAEAAALGTRSMVCMPLWADERCLGTLSLYADRPAAFDRRDEQIAGLLATLAALALADALRAEQLHTALAGRDLIGQAKGILMERERISADAAFGRLARQSQLRNVKLTAIARHLVETGELLGGDREVQRTPE